MNLDQREMIVTANRRQARASKYLALGHHATQWLEHLKVLIHVPVRRYRLATHGAREEVYLTPIALCLDLGEWRARKGLGSCTAVE